LHTVYGTAPTRRLKLSRLLCSSRNGCARSKNDARTRIVFGSPATLRSPGKGQSRGPWYAPAAKVPRCGFSRAEPCILFDLRRGVMMRADSIPLTPTAPLNLAACPRRSLADPRGRWDWPGGNRHHEPDQSPSGAARPGRCDGLPGVAARPDGRGAPLRPASARPPRTSSERTATETASRHANDALAEGAIDALATGRKAAGLEMDVEAVRAYVARRRAEWLE